MAHSLKRGTEVAAACALALTVTATRPARAEDRLNRDRSGHSELRGELPVRKATRIVDAAQARLNDEEMVIGVVAGGRARAYPVNVMWGPENEVVNDVLGETPVATSWCPIALSGEVYARDLAGGQMELGAVGAEDGVLVLYDQATHSRWSQVAGRAVAGPLAGTRLRKLPSLVTTWGRWRALHPDTSVYVGEEPPAERPRFTEQTVSMVSVGEAGPVRNEDWVIGLEGKTGAGAFVVRQLVEKRAVNEVFDGQPIVAFLTEDLTTATVWARSLDGRVLTFAAKADELVDVETGSRWHPLTGKALAGPLAGLSLARVPSSAALWYAWKAQYPETRVLGLTAGSPPPSPR